MQKKLIKLFDTLQSKIYFNYNIGKLTWFRTGGNAKAFAIIENTQELEIILNELNQEKYFVLGSGSNLLIRDLGFNGIIIKLGKDFNKSNIIEDKLEVGSSVLDINLSKFALKNNIEGFEFFTGIPGSIGGAIKMNAGCYGSETKDILHSIEIYNQNAEKMVLMKKDINLNYRLSNIQNSQIITKAKFNFSYAEKIKIKEKMDEIKKHRLNSQPIKNKTSGSTFKNPSNFFAAKLIEDANCKGLNIGDAHVSTKHANFLINQGNATASDLENLGKLVIEKVYNKFNIILDWEIKIIGD